MVEAGGRWQDETVARFVSEGAVLQRKGWDDVESAASNGLRAFIWLGSILDISVEYTGARICIEKWRTYMDELIHEHQMEIFFPELYLCFVESGTKPWGQFFVIIYGYVIM